MVQLQAAAPLGVLIVAVQGQRSLLSVEVAFVDGREQTQDVHALVSGDTEITRGAVSSMRSERSDAAANVPAVSSSVKLLARANAACDRLEQALGRIKPPGTCDVAPADLTALRVRITDLATCWLQGSDRQTPKQTSH